jgi:hypothetical protein
VVRPRTRQGRPRCASQGARSNAGCAPHRSRTIALTAIVALTASSCTLITDSFLTNEFSGDPYPIDVETDTGALVVGVRQAGAEDRVAVIDLLSPFTLTDPGPSVPPLISYASLTLLGRPGSGGAPGAPIDLATTVPRARFRDAQVLSLHPCPDLDGDNMPNLNCVLGAGGATRVFQSVIGADALAGDAVRLRLGDGQIFILADVGGNAQGRSLSCDAVFGSPYRGGGTLIIAGTELPFGNRRITLQACLGPDADPGPLPDMDAGIDRLRQHGANALLVVSTSIGISILGQAAYDRYRIAVAGEIAAPPFESLPPASVYLPSGLVEGRLATINRLALVARSTSNPLSPCRQIWAHDLLLRRECAAPEEDCPCKDGSDFCPVPAVLALNPPAGLDVLVVSDIDPTLQALRTELRPDQPEVDGLLGTNALRTAEIDVDYPHDRLLARCTRGNCTARPQLSERRDRTQVAGCLAGQPTGPVGAR